MKINLKSTNVLVIVLIVAIGAITYLLVSTGAVNPSLGSSSGIKGVKKAEKYNNRNQVTVELDGEEIQEILNNQDYQKLVATPEFSKLVSDPDFIKMLDEGLGIMSNLEEGYIDIKGKMGDGWVEQSNVDYLGGSNVGGSSGNPANRDSGINDGGGVEILTIGTINKIVSFQKYMKNQKTFEKFQKDASFNKFLKSGNYQKFHRSADFQKLMKSDNFSKWMKGERFNKFNKTHR